jgi:hypothetical protein
MMRKFYPYLGAQVLISYVWFTIAKAPIGISFMESIFLMSPVLMAIHYCIKQAMAA